MSLRLHYIFILVVVKLYNILSPHNFDILHYLLLSVAFLLVHNFVKMKIKQNSLICVLKFVEFGICAFAPALAVASI